MLKQRLQDDMKAAMKSGDKARLGVIRLINAAIKQREVDERIELDDTQVLAVLDKMLKQRRDSITQFEKAGREDLAAKERFEVSVCQTTCPRPCPTPRSTVRSPRPSPPLLPAGCGTWARSWPF
jgi:uncharacterized protein YqeY